MFKNYLKIAFRNIVRYKGFSFINISGLAIGMAVCILMLLGVQDELSYDKFHVKKDRIFRILNKRPNGTFSVNLTYALPPFLKEKYPEVEEFSRVLPWHKSLVKYREKRYEEKNIYLVDPGFFTMFSFNFIKGKPESALLHKNSIIMTQKAAQRYFGAENPIGKVIFLEEPGADFEVTGVITNMPPNSHLKFDIVTSVKWLGEDRLARWNEWVAHAYVLLKNGDFVDSVNNKISGIYKEYVSKDARTIPILQPFTKVHLYEYGDATNLTKIYIFSIIAILILVIACINFMNLSTACSAHRAREVGMRKVIGATRYQVVKQFLGEAIIISFLSMIFAVFLVLTILPFFNNFTNKELSLFIGSNISILAIIFLTTLITGLISGSYPALFLSSFKPVLMLKNRVLKNTSGVKFRNVLIVFQFAISTGLIICTFTISRQLNFILNRDLGFDREHIITLKNNPELMKRFYSFKEKLLSNPGILNVTSAAQKPLSVGSRITMNWKGNRDDSNWFYTMVDYDFFKTFKMDIIKGRSFSKKFPTDETQACIINELAMKEMNIKNPIGTDIYFGHMDPIFDKSLRYVRVIGVVKDFHSSSLHYPIKPFLFRIYKPWHSYIFIRVNSNMISDALKSIETDFQKYAPEYPFNFEFLDEAFNIQYSSEMELKKLLNFFSLLSIFVACLGLFGLAAFTAEQKTKEIGIRKVFGASVSGIVTMLSKEFTKWVLIANVIAWPVAYIFMNKWLQNFSYRTNIGVELFIFSGIIAFIIAILTVSYQSIKAAAANPIDSLKYE
jgi:putative ABC transport system permease protein